MGISGINMGSLLIILLIIVLLFGTKRLRGIGADLGAALRSFRQGVAEDNKQQQSDNKAGSIPSRDQEQDS